MTLPGTVTDAPPGEAVKVYCVISDPPSNVGGVQLTIAELLPGLAVTPLGAKGSGYCGLPVNQRLPWSLGQGSPLLPAQP